MSAGQPRARQNSTRITFRASTGRIWHYSGKRGRVLAMLASGQGVTQWCTLPWHTRLGGTIHAMRKDGLTIETVREGEFRHARYWLRTPGTLQGGEPTELGILRGPKGTLIGGAP